MRYVAISIHGHYLSVVGDFVGSLGALLDEVVGAVRADGTGIGDPSIFERVERGPDLVSFRQLDGAWLGLAEGRLVRIPDEAAAEVFTEVWWPDDRISLRASTGRFVCAERGGGQEVVVNRAQAADWEKFFYEQVPDALLPKQEEPRIDVTTGVQEAIRDAVERTQVDVSAPWRQTLDEGRGDSVSDVTRRFP